MNSHPNSEEWMSFLYGEDSPARHAELNEHLHQCASCRQQVQSWRGSMASLDEWKITPTKRRAPMAPVLRWAAAAAVVIGIGFGLGRATTSSNAADLKALQASMQKEMDARFAGIREDLTRSLDQRQAELAQSLHTLAAEAVTEESEDLLAKVAKTIDAQRIADQRAVLAALNQLQEQYINSYATLRQDLDTVAVNAEEQILELATLNKSSDR